MKTIMNFLINLGSMAKDFYNAFGILGIITFYGMFFFVGMMIRVIIDVIINVILPLF